MQFLKKFFDHKTPGSFVNRLRQKRFTLLQDPINQLIKEKGNIRILDIGGELDYWQHIGWKNEHCLIYLFNLETANRKQDIPGFIHVTGTALDLPYRSGDFDLVFSNSVIEHVGSRKNQQKFAEEVKRVCPRYIIQTPSFWFPLEPHSLLPLFQYIPHKLRAVLIMAFNINYFPKAATYSEAVTVSKSTIMMTEKEFKALFPEAEIYVEKLFGIPKSYTAIKL
ncbi:MAG: methyltransferase type 11 [Sediminibacterium sp.]|nr:methyltransferase type 11 [Sediminibacterium sp.]